MSKVFEDEFMEIQSGFVSLCLEALETANASVDKIYIYAFCSRYEDFFNIFFVKDGKLLHNNEAGIPDDVIEQVLDLGIDDMEKIIKLSDEYGRQIPNQYKLVYDCVSGKFDADYEYDDTLSPLDVFLEWEKEIENGLKK